MTTRTADPTMQQIADDLHDLRLQLVRLGNETVDATLDAWRARIDSLVVQADLARLDGRDEVRASLEEADRVWRWTRDRLLVRRGADAAAGEALVEGVRAARADLAAAVELAEEQLAAARR
jgi:hypothetical protein